MRLAKKVNYILLPVIAVVFIISGLITDRINRTQVLNFIETDIKYKSEFIDGKLEQYIFSIDSAFQKFVNSNEYSNFVVAEDNYVTLERVESFLDNEFQFTKNSLPGFQSIILLDELGNIIVSIDGRSIFDEPTLPELPSDLFLSKQLQLPTGSRTELYETESGSFKLASVRCFSDTASFGWNTLRGKGKRDCLLAVTDVSDLFDYDKLTEGIFIDEFNLKIENNEGTNKFFRDDLHFSYVLSMFSYEFKLSPLLISEHLIEFRKQFFLLIVLLIVFSFLILQWLITKVIIKPVTLLTKNVERRDGEYIQFQEGDDEVSLLNNAYHRLFSSVQRLASFDSLTNLANRSSFNKYLERLLKEKNKRNSSLTLLYIDLDNFKNVNDHYGHETGDSLLIEFSKRLRDNIRVTDAYSVVERSYSVARLAGDEFSIVLSDTTNTKDIVIVVERILNMFDDGFFVDGHNHNVKASIGIAISPQDGDDVATLIKHADAAMYKAKGLGRNRYQFFTAEIEDALNVQLKIERELKASIEYEEFFLVYMPTYEIGTNKVMGAEALLRSTNPVLLECGPDIFIPVAESTGLIKAMDLWVIEQALMALNRWITDFAFDGMLSVNISAVELHNEHFIPVLTNLLEKYNTPVAQLEFELTETSLVASDELTIDTLNTLKDIGIKLSLDDFGTGYTGFTQLVHYPVDTLKIDRSFVSQLGQSEQSDNFMKVFIELAKIYKLPTVAEGVETYEQLQVLTKLGFNFAQGYYFSKPIKEAEFLLLFKNQTSNTSI